MKIESISTRIAGIPLEEVGPRLKELNEAIEKQSMAVGADTAYNVNFLPGDKNRVVSVTMTVYLFQKEDHQDRENLGNSKAVKNPEE
jgi:hypothetical protein